MSPALIPVAPVLRRRPREEGKREASKEEMENTHPIRWFARKAPT